MISPFDDYTVTTAKAPEAAVSAVQSRAQGKGFVVLHVHDLGKVFGEHGFPGEPAYVVELCNVGFGAGMLRWNPMASLMMPCKIAVYEKEGDTHISALRPRLMGDLFPQFAPQVEEADRVIVSIVEESR